MLDVGDTAVGDTVVGLLVPLVEVAVEVEVVVIALAGCLVVAVVKIVGGDVTFVLLLEHMITGGPPKEIE